MQSPEDLDMEDRMELTHMPVSDIVDKATNDVNKLLQKIAQCKAEEAAAAGNDETLAASRVNAKIKGELRRFFDLRREFAEQPPQASSTTTIVSDTSDLSCEMDANICH